MNVFTSLMRTLVPLLAGLALTALARIGVSFNSTAVVSVMTTVLSGAYYTLFRLLESLAGKIQNKQLAMIAGFFLGWATPPDYAGTTPAVPGSASVRPVPGA